MSGAEAVARAVVEGIEDPTEPNLERRTLGSTDPGEIGEIVAGFCRDKLGAGIKDCLFVHSSQTTVFGLVLSNGRHIALKAHDDRFPRDFLQEVQRVQRHLVASGFPSPIPLGGPMPLGPGLATVEVLTTYGEHADAHRPEIRRSMADGLARLVELGGGIVPRPVLKREHILNRHAGHLYPKPHHEMFDLERTGAGAEWIDALARKASAILEHEVGELVVGHTDWAAKDFRFDGDRITAIYDWESLVVDREPVVVGPAAAHFTMTWHLPVRLTPEPEEVAAFVEEYERARGRPFSPDERAAVGASIVLTFAYTSRCEHALAPEEREYPAGSSREALATNAERFLAI